ncbi:MAG: Fe(3+) ABC transporter substrate-binding protein, partial [Synechococcaceae cyanobacterium SM2_3_60]|nr:Fe(3+) ABC transporter substrate-binding protein [Synechococcaceae cyanobacterium SM2_3_60]
PNQADRGVHVNISGAGVLANAPNPENAQAYLEFLASQEVQTEFAAANNEFPVVPDTPLPERVQVMMPENLKTDTLDLTLLGVHNPAAVRIADESGWP